MKLSDIRDPKNFFQLINMVKEDYAATYIVSEEQFNQLMKHLETYGWFWSGTSKEKPTEYTPNFVYPIYICLCKNDEKIYYDSNSKARGYMNIIIDWEDVSIPLQVNGTFCSCTQPRLKKVPCGLGGNAKYFDYCELCKKEKQ
jgi:hypothetical protein